MDNTDPYKTKFKEERLYMSTNQNLMAKPLLQREGWRITLVTAFRCDFWSWAQSPVRPSVKTRTT